MEDRQSLKLSILIPIFNERRTLRTIIKRILNAPLHMQFELIIVDDCSTDGSVEVLEELAANDERIRVFFHERNTGKGGAVHTAIEQMTGDIAIIQDADLEYDPAEISRVIEPIVDGRAEAVFGSRFAGSECRRVLYYWHSIGNKFLTWMANCVCDLNLTDMETCYKAVKSEILKQTPLRFKRFGIEPELTIRLAQWGARIYEVPISYSGRTYAEGKKITWVDGLQALAVIFFTAFIDRRFTTHDGYYILTAVRGDRLNKWMFKQFQRFVGQRVLEAGCGIGSLTCLMLDRDSLTSVDVDPLYVQMLSRRFGHLENFRVLQIDLASPTDYGSFENESFDTIICLNVMEHLEDDLQLLQNFNRLLAPGGHAIILVPQHKALFNEVDRTLGHYRRYDKKDLHEKMAAAGFDVVQVSDFNKLGCPGWWLNGNILHRRHITPHQLWLFDLLIPFAKLMEQIPGFPALSVIATGRKPA